MLTRDSSSRLPSCDQTSTSAMKGRIKQVSLILRGGDREEKRDGEGRIIIIDTLIDIASTLKLTHFIDDTLAVLTHLVDVVPNLYLYDAAPLSYLYFPSSFFLHLFLIILIDDRKQNHYMYFLPQIHKIRDECWTQLEDIFVTKDLV